MVQLPDGALVKSVRRGSHVELWLTIDNRTVHTEGHGYYATLKRALDAIHVWNRENPHRSVKLS